MPGTTARSIPYPLAGERPDGAAQMKAIAERMDALLDDVWALLNAATSAASASTIARRDSAGRVAVGAGTNADHATQKQYVDQRDGEQKALLDNRIRTGVASVSTNSNGDFSLSFASAFPSQLVGCVMQDATSPQALGGILLKGTAGSYTRSGVTGRAYGTNGAALANVNIAVSYVAIGF